MTGSKIITLLLVLTFNLSAQSWQMQLLDSADGFINDASIALDNQDRPHIIYPWVRQVSTNLEEFWVKYAKYDSLSWEFQAVDTIVADGGPIFFSTKLCLDNQNYPHAAYIIRDYNPQTGRNWVKIIYNYWNGTTWHKSTIDSFNVTNNYIGAFIDQRNLDLTLNYNNIPYLCYPYINIVDSIWQVKYAYKVSNSWTVRTVWQQPLSQRTYRTRISIDTAGFPYFVFDVNKNQLPNLILCAHYREDTLEVDTVSTFQSSQVFVYSLKIDRINRFHLLFSCGFNIFYAVKQGNVWNTEFIDDTDVSSNHGELALYQNEPYIIYSSPMTHVTYAYKNTIWHNVILDSEHPGLFPSIAIDHQGNKYFCYVRYGIIKRYICYIRRIEPAIEEHERILPTTHINFYIYPNPAKTFFTVRLPHPADRSEVKIFDITGKIVKEEKLKGVKDEKISLTRIKNGVYFMKVGDEIVKEKLVVTK